MDTAQINQNILNVLINALTKNKLNYADSIIFKNKLITFFNENINITPLHIKCDNLIKNYNINNINNINIMPIYIKCHHLIKNYNIFMLNCVPYEEINNAYIKRNAIYNEIYLEQSCKIIKFVYSLFDSEYIYSKKSKRIYTELTLELEFKLYKESNFNQLLSSFNKIGFKNSVKKLTFYLKFPEMSRYHSKCMIQLIRAIALNFHNIEQLKIFSLKQLGDKLIARNYDVEFIVYENIYENSDYDAMEYMVRMCAKYLPKLKLLHYCSKYCHGFIGTTMRKFVSYFNLKEKQFNRNYFKVQYDNTQNNIEMSKILLYDYNYYV